MLAVLLTAGASFAFCPHAMAVSHGCCAGMEAEPAEPEGRDTVASDRACCEQRQLGHLPEFDRDEHERLSPPALAGAVSIDMVAASPPLMAGIRVPAKARVGFADPIRAGPLSGRDRCLLLQVLLH